jgi:hypothetical protein
MVSGKKTGQQQPQLDTSLATRAFELSLFFWVPLINLFVNPIVITFAILSLIKQKRNPKNIGGRGFAIAALSICTFGLFIMLYSIITLGPKIVFSEVRNTAAFDVSPFVYPLIIIAELLLIFAMRKFGLIPIYKEPTRKNTGFATIAFALSLIFWMPLFSIISNPLSLILAIISLRRCIREPEKYGGFKRSLFALEVCGIGVLLFIYALVFIGPTEVFTR